MSKKPLASDIVLNKLLWFGGDQKTRKQIFDELIAEGFDRKYVDFYLFCLANHQKSFLDAHQPSGGERKERRP